MMTPIAGTFCCRSTAKGFGGHSVVSISSSRLALSARLAQATYSVVFVVPVQNFRVNHGSCQGPSLGEEAVIPQALDTQSFNLETRKPIIMISTQLDGDRLLLASQIICLQACKSCLFAIRIIIMLVPSFSFYMFLLPPCFEPVSLQASHLCSLHSCRGLQPTD